MAAAPAFPTAWARDEPNATASAQDGTVAAPGFTVRALRSEPSPGTAGGGFGTGMNFGGGSCRWSRPSRKRFGGAATTTAWSAPHARQAAVSASTSRPRRRAAHRAAVATKHGAGAGRHDASWEFVTE